MTDEELMYIAWQELIKPLPQYKEPANISMPLDTGDNRKLPIRTFVGGDFGDPENMPGVVALSMKTNPSLAESCYDPRLQALLELIPQNIDDIVVNSRMSENIFRQLLVSLNIDKAITRYEKYIDRVVHDWPWDNEKNEYFSISDTDQKRIKRCFLAAIGWMEYTAYYKDGRRIVFAPCKQQ